MANAPLARIDPVQPSNSSRALAAAGQDVGKAMEAVMINGDLTPLTPADRAAYYMQVCKSLDLNPFTKPFAYLKLNGKLTLYALRDCTDQLRDKRGVSVEIIDKKIANGMLTVHVRARTPDGRTDEDVGAVPMGEKLAGEAFANALMKAVTKAKRRVTLSICGLGWSDESEVESIPGAQVVDELFPPQEQDAYIVRLEEEFADMDPGEVKEAWAAHEANSQARLDANHAIKALRLYEAAMKRAATAAKE